MAGAEGEGFAAGEGGELGGGLGVEGANGDHERRAEIKGADERWDGGAELVGRVAVAGLGELVVEPGFFGREGEAFDGDVVGAELLKDLLGAGFAAGVLLLADEEEVCGGWWRAGF